MISLVIQWLLRNVYMANFKCSSGDPGDTVAAATLALNDRSILHKWRNVATFHRQWTSSLPHDVPTRYMAVTDYICIPGDCLAEAVVRPSVPGEVRAIPEN